MITVLVHTRDASKATPYPLSTGRHRAGGAKDDAVVVPGASPGALELDVSVDGAIVIARVDGLSLGGRPLSPGARWLFRAGDRIRLPDAELTLSRVEGFNPDSTEGLARAVLSGALKSAPSEAVPTLVWLNGLDCGKRLPLLDEATFLGRGEGAAARVRDPRASRIHAKIVVQDGAVTLFDQQSGNGLLVDGKRVSGSTALSGGAVIRIGDTEIAFETGASQAAPPTPEPALTSSAPTSRPRSAGPLPSDKEPQPPRRYTATEVAMIGGGAMAGTLGAVLAWLLAA
jgi:hypothetical protein